MISPSIEPAAELSAALQQYHQHADLGALLDTLRDIAARTPAEALPALAEPYRDDPAVVIPIYERLVAERPSDARALVMLANAYWLTGRGPEVVGELASRAITADAGNRGAWHLWALSESNVRARVARWQQVSDRFPSDQLARAALADNAASLAGGEHDPLALDLALRTYESLLAETTEPGPRAALEGAITTLRGWKL
jgi:hypothetical protein